MAHGLTMPAAVNPGANGSSPTPVQRLPQAEGLAPGLLERGVHARPLLLEQAPVGQPAHPLGFRRERPQQAVRAAQPHPDRPRPTEQPVALALVLAGVGPADARPTPETGSAV